jgi:hypothetical protein
MAFQGFLKQSTAVDVLIGPFLDEDDGKTAETGLTIEDEHVLLSKNGQARAAKNDANDAVHDAGGYHNCPLDATDTNTVGQLTIMIHVSGALPVRLDYHIVEEAVYDAMYGSSAAGPLQSTVAARTLDVTAGGTTGIDWGNVENPTTAVDLSSTDIQLCDTITTYTGNTPQTADHTAGIADIPTVTEFNARTLVAADYFDPAVDVVANVTLVGTTTTNTDMRGTDNAALASVCTEVRLAELAAANLPADIDAILLDTGTTIPATITTLQTAVDDIPTTAEFEARTLVAASYFDPAVDTVANVTTVGSVTTKTGYSLVSTGLDLVLIDGETLPSSLQLIGAVVLGKISGAGTGTEIFVGLDDATTRVTVTVDASGNRTAVTKV